MNIKIAFVTRLDPLDIRQWSGLNFFIFNCLKNLGYEVDLIGPLSNRLRYAYLIKKFFFYLFDIKFDIDRLVNVSKDLSRQVQKKILVNEYNLIFTTDTTTVSFLQTKIPIIIWHDMDFYTYYLHYFKKKKISFQTIKEGNLCEKYSYNAAKKIILTSKWAKKSAIKKYGINRNKILVLPFGANLCQIPSKQKIINNIYKKNFKICNLVSIGVDWDRKGMDRAVQLVEIMNSKGINTKLNIIGPKYLKKFQDHKKIKIIGFLDKNKYLEEKKMVRYLLNSHFHILFPKAEGCGVAFAEASAFGLYSITNDIGGISNMIINNKNGFCFNPNFNVDLIADYLIKIFKNPKEYFLKSHTSRIQYEKRLNWKSLGNKLKKIVNNNLEK
jgi:glycosyltransferase involved in cell wall biosynthesis